MGFKKAEVAELILGMESGCIPKLVAAGHLKSIKEYCPEAQRRLTLITRDSVSKFQETYVSPVEIARATDYGPHTVVAQLSKCGLLPVFDAKTFRATFYVRSDVEKLLRTAPTAIKAKPPLAEIAQ